MDSRSPDAGCAATVESLIANVEAVRRLARALVRDVDDAEDLAQEALCLAVERPPRAGWPIGRWLAGVVRNLARTRRRGARRRAEREVRSARPDRLPGDQELVARVEIQRRVLAQVLALAPAYRSVVVLRYVQGLPASEIARLEGVPVETVRTRLKRAVEMLRASLDAEHGGRRAAWAGLLLPGVPRPVEDGGPPTPPSPPRLPLPWAPALQVGALVGLAAAGLSVGWLALRPSPATDSARARADGAEGGGTVAGEPAGLRGTGRAYAATRGLPGRPTADPFAAIDRDADLHGTIVLGDDTPVAGATVVALEFPWRAVPGSDPRRADEEEELGRTVADADGAFRIRLARGQQAVLRVTAAGCARREVEHCQAGQRVRVEMDAAATLVVAVRDEAGSPVADAAVQVWWESSNTAEARPAPWHGDTDAAGTCRFEDLPAGASVGVAVRHPAHASPPPLRTLALATSATSASVTMPLGRTIAGRVTDAETSLPVVGARVAGDWSPGTWWIGHAAVSGPDGRFAVAGWASGIEGNLAVDADGYERAETRATRGPEPVDVRLKGGVAVSGRLVDAGGAGVARARIGVEEVLGLYRGGAPARGTDSGPDGRFRLGGLRRDGACALHVLAPGFGLVAIDFRPAEAVAGVVDVGEVVLSPAASLEGRVLFEDGAPVVGAVVRLGGGSADRGRLMPGGLSASVDSHTGWTDDLGRFRFRALLPGRYDLTCSTTGGVSAERRGLLLGAEGRLDLELRVAAGRSLNVTVLCDGGGVAACPLEFVTRAGRVVRAGDTGRGQANLTVPADATAVRVEAAWAAANGYRASQEDIPPGAFGTVLLLHLRYATEIGGIALAPDGRPLSGAEILVSWGDHRVGVLADAAGRFRAAVPRDGVVSLELTGGRADPAAASDGGGEKAATASDPAPAFAGRLDAVRAGVGDCVLKAHALDPSRTLRVRLLDPDGAPLAGARIVVEGDRSGRTDADGRVAIEGLPGRALRLEVRVEGGAPDADWLRPLADRVEPGETEVVLRMRRAHRLDGVVLGPTGRPVPGADLYLTQARQSWITGKTDDAGRFTLRMDPDRYFPVELRACRVSQGTGAWSGSLTLPGPPTEPVTVRLQSD